MDFWWQTTDALCAQIKWASLFQHDMEEQKGEKKKKAGKAWKTTESSKFKEMETLFTRKYM